ncbi:MAG: hypothetical protein LBU94_01335 [Clostridiales bacterium]|jgi:hypothetical protein|nr:hypothetical protein [Clostridiales bacterium]
MTRSRIHIDKLHAAQREGFISLNPWGYNAFGGQFERVLPATSIANLNPFSYAGITDSRGFLLGKDMNGTYVIKDLTKKTNDIPNKQYFNPRQ